jgi:hypothetical protein
VRLMSPRAPVHVPVELRRLARESRPSGGDSRWFRLASAVSVEGLLLANVVPDELAGPLDIAFHLPGDREPIRCTARPSEEVIGTGEDERSERSAVVFIDLDESGRTRILNYVNERLGPLA